MNPKECIRCSRVHLGTGDMCWPCQKLSDQLPPADRRNRVLTRQDASEAFDLAVRLSPSHDVATKLGLIYHAMIREGESWKSITLSMLGAAHDGLAWGNWP